MEYIIDIDPKGLESALKDGRLDPSFTHEDTGVSLVHSVACLNPWYYMGEAEAQDTEWLEWFDQERLHMLDILYQYGAPMDTADYNGYTPSQVVHSDDKDFSRALLNYTYMQMSPPLEGIEIIETTDDPPWPEWL